MTASSELLRRAEAVFFHVAALPEAERAEAIERLCGADGELASEVESLCVHAERARGFLEEPALGSDFALLSARASGASQRSDERDEMIGRTVGRYRIERRIASGGMGTVYLAARADAEFVQRVALKIVKRGLDTEEILQRFRRERQTLAALEHPNIARLIDGGATESGQPYLAMEFVEGEPIDAYCDRRRLGIEARLELFLTVCDAVRHAHQKLVVHRDLKPSNILVTSDGTPKLLDFGIAAVIDASRGAHATSPSERRLTPEYASPEQVAGAAVATTSDVYSLGVVLCELLTGRRPDSFATGTATDIQGVVTNTPPAAPSELARRDERIDASRAAARARAASSTELARRLRGDLDTIVLAALRKEPERRYPSVERLAADVRRHLDHLPVSARRDTLAYRASKFVRRHALASAFTGLLALSLAGGGAAIAWQAHVAARERDQAVAARAESDEIIAFLQRMLESPDPARAGSAVTVREVLDEAAQRLDGELAEQPLVRARLRVTIGKTYFSLGSYTEAEAQLRAGQQALLELRGPLHRDVAESKVDLASVLHAVAALDEAASLLDGALAIYREVSGPESAEVATVLSSLGAVRRAQGRQGEAERLQRQALDLRRRVTAADSLDVAESLNNLASVLIDRQPSDEARTLLEDALRIRSARLGPDHPLVAQSTDNLAVALHRMGALDRAEPLYRRALELEVRVLGAEHPDVAVTRRNLAILLASSGRPSEAERELRLCLAVREKTLQVADLRRVMTLLDLADVLAAQDQVADAVPLIEAALDSTRELAIDAPAREHALERGARLFERAGRSESAAELRAELARR